MGLASWLDLIFAALRAAPLFFFSLDSPCLPGDVICACGANDRSGGLLAA